jgi:hypothetical protein
MVHAVVSVMSFVAGFLGSTGRCQAGRTGAVFRPETYGNPVVASSADLSEGGCSLPEFRFQYASPFLL